ncbi:hypothetical protein D3C85_1539290 [compost metagenome]
MGFRTLFFPLTIDHEDVRQGRMADQHFLGFFIQQYVDLRLRVVLLQGIDDRRDQQHVAVVAKFNDQNTLYRGIRSKGWRVVHHESLSGKPIFDSK